MEAEGFEDHCPNHQDTVSGQIIVVQTQNQVAMAVNKHVQIGPIHYVFIKSLFFSPYISQKYSTDRKVMSILMINKYKPQR